MLIDRGRSQLLLIDIQSKLAPHVANGGTVVANCTRLATYARRLGVPTTLTEHYPKGLGPTAAPVLEALGNDVPRFAKIAFSSWKDDAIRARIEGLKEDGLDQVVVAGMEAHVCVGQTSLDLLANGLAHAMQASATSPYAGSNGPVPTSSPTRWSPSNGSGGATRRSSRISSR